MDNEGKGAVNAGDAHGAKQHDLKFELYKLEYERGAIRYEDLYKAVWQIFSYMTAISGALLAFGGDRFQVNLFWSLASAPLVYWFLGTYLPLDHYGSDIGRRLGVIEELLNRTYGVSLDQYRSFERRKSGSAPKNLRVCYVVYPVFGLLTFFCGYQAIRAFSARYAGAPMLRESPTGVKVVTVDTETLRKLIEGATSTSQQPTIQPNAPLASTKSN